MGILAQRTALLEDLSTGTGEGLGQAERQL
jgi:hypothetical protein